MMISVSARARGHASGPPPLHMASTRRRTSSGGAANASMRSGTDRMQLSAATALRAARTRIATSVASMRPRIAGSQGSSLARQVAGFSGSSHLVAHGLQPRRRLAVQQRLLLEQHGARRHGDARAHRLAVDGVLKDLTPRVILARGGGGAGAGAACTTCAHGHASGKGEEGMSKGRGQGHDVPVPERCRVLVTLHLRVSGHGDQLGRACAACACYVS